MPSANHRAMFLTPQKRENSENRLDLRTAITGIVVPIVVALIATQVDAFRAALLIGLAIITVAVFGGPNLRRRYRLWVDGRSDSRLARETMPRIQSLFARFGDFTFSDRSNTLHFIINNDVRPTSHAGLESMRIAEQEVLHSWWRTLDRRVQSCRPSIGEAMRSLEDLHDLIYAYKRGCFDPVFDRPTSAFLAILDARVAAELESVREHFTSYLSRVEDLAEYVTDRTKTLAPPRYYVERPKPLRSVAMPK